VCVCVCLGHFKNVYDDMQSRIYAAAGHPFVC